MKGLDYCLTIVKCLESTVSRTSLSIIDPMLVGNLNYIGKMNAVSRKMNTWPESIAEAYSEIDGFRRRSLIQFVLSQWPSLPPLVKSDP